jgi:predicted transcriptional regulator
MKTNIAQEFLKKSRRTLGFTQKGLALATGFETHDIKNYENGLARTPGDLILKLQEMLKASKRREGKEKGA